MTETSTLTNDTKALSVKMALSNWDLQNSRLNKILEGISDEELMNEIAPGRNRGIYILGHLAAVSDATLPILGFGDKMYPQFEPIFIRTPDRTVAEMPTAAEVRKAWHALNAKLTSEFNKLSADEWFEKHNSVSAEDFAKEPHRNKLNLIQNRTAHLGYHMGQLVLLNKK